jgi:hypothetical protein
MGGRCKERLQDRCGRRLTVAEFQGESQEDTARRFCRAAGGQHTVKWGFAATVAARRLAVQFLFVR